MTPTCRMVYNTSEATAPSTIEYTSNPTNPVGTEFTTYDSLKIEEKWTFSTPQAIKGYGKMKH